MPGNFLSDARNYKFDLLGARYFCIPRSILELYSGTEVSNFETDRAFQNLAFMLLSNS